MMPAPPQETHMFVTLRGSVSVSAANLPPGLREAIESAAGGAAGGGDGWTAAAAISSSLVLL